MPKRHILVVAIDGLRASALGAYGNTVFPTPALDQFATDSFLLDTCIGQSPALAEIYRGLWHSIQPVRRSETASTTSLPRLLNESGYRTTLLSDEPELLSLPTSKQFTHTVNVAQNTAPTRQNSISQSTMARVFAAACDEVADAGDEAPQLVWVHSRGMYGPWDAPLELQDSLLDENDPPPIESIEPPDLTVNKSTDPDSSFRHGCAYAAQVMVLDACWNALSEAIESAGGANDWLVMLLGARGFPLGEHGRIGGVDPRLYIEQLHVPWLIRFPDGIGRLARSTRLVSHVDLLPTILDKLELPAETGTDGLSIRPLASSLRAEWRDALVSVSDVGGTAIRTDEWCLRQPVPPDKVLANAAPAASSELYVRPDDRWEANDVAKLCADEIEMLSNSLTEMLQQLGRY